jgi:hypothetical protein
MGICDGKLKMPTASEMGKKGGKACGSCKARTTEQARAAVMVRWAKHKKAKEEALNVQGQATEQPIAQPEG